MKTSSWIRMVDGYQTHRPLITYLVTSDIAQWAKESFGCRADLSVDMEYIDLTEEQEIMMMLKFS